MHIDITGLDKYAVVAALYNRSRVLGLGILHAEPGDMTAEEARQYTTGYIDYLKGRAIKVNIRGDTLDPQLYDQDNGEGAAAEVIDRLRGSSRRRRNMIAIRQAPQVITVDLDWTADKIEAHLNRWERGMLSRESCTHPGAMRMVAGMYCGRCEQIVTNS